MKIEFDKAGVKTAVRTAGALMVGNAFVGYFVLNKRDIIDIVALFSLGLLVIIFASISRGNK